MDRRALHRVELIWDHADNMEQKSKIGLDSGSVSHDFKFLTIPYEFVFSVHT